MFTGIVEEIGTIRQIEMGRHSAVLHIDAKEMLTDIHIGDSIAVNGVCLTVTALRADGFAADAMHETLNRTTLAALKNGSHINLERAMAADGRFGGHIVACGRSRNDCKITAGRYGCLVYGSGAADHYALYYRKRLHCGGRNQPYGGKGV